MRLMARHRGKSEEEANQEEAQRKGEEFDELFNNSLRDAARKRERGEYPYDLDSKVKKS